MKLLTFFGSVFGLLLLAAILFPVFAKAKMGGGPHQSCFGNLKEAARGLMFYTEDTDGRFPPRDGWIDASYPYVKTWQVFHCPQVKPSPWGYAFNGVLSLAKPHGDPAKVPLAYDSVNPSKNASDLVASLPAVPRHVANIVAYADGHAGKLAAGGKP